MVKRVATFVLLGPLLVWLSAFLWLVPEMIRKPPDSGALAFMFMAVLIVAAVGLIPALALAGADEAMARLRLWRVWRAVICAALSYPLTALAIWIGLSDLGLRSFNAELPITALLGVLPAAVCSWLAGRGGRGKGV